jgi:hypothetical protein
LHGTRITCIITALATWNQLRQYLQETYKHEPFGDQGGLRMLFDLGQGRSQVIVIEPQLLMDGEEEWAVIESPIGDIRQIDLLQALQEMGTKVCGGLAAAGNAPDLLVMRHAVPLANLDLNEFERPIGLLLHSADALERQLVGEDRF